MSPPVVVEPVDVHQSRRTTPAYPRQRECRARRLLRRETRSSPEAGAETPALLLSTSISLPPGSVETAALRQEQAPAPVSVSWLRVVQQTRRVLAHDGTPAIELTIWRSRWPGRSPRRSSSCGGRGTIPSDGIRSPAQLGAGDRIGDTAVVRLGPDLSCGRRSDSPSSRRPPLDVRDACFAPECESGWALAEDRFSAVVASAAAEAAASPLAWPRRDRHAPAG